MSTVLPAQEVWKRGKEGKEGAILRAFGGCRELNHT
jgi:hypothetical protein